MGFWDTKSPGEFTLAEWESLCDGCGRCCLVKIEEEESGELYYTAITCAELDIGSCRCNHYQSRTERVADCIALTARTVDEYSWLPRTCAYRLISAGQPLPSWHPLITGTMDSVHAAGISVRNFAVSQHDVEDGLDFEDYLLEDNP